MDDVEHVLSLGVEGLESARVAKDHGLTALAHLVVARTERTADRAERHHVEARRLINTYGLNGLRLGLELITTHLARIDGRLDEAAETLRAALRRERS